MWLGSKDCRQNNIMTKYKRKVMSINYVKICRELQQLIQTKIIYDN